MVSAILFYWPLASRNVTQKCKVPAVDPFGNVETAGPKQPSVLEPADGLNRACWAGFCGFLTVKACLRLVGPLTVPNQSIN